MTQRAEIVARNSSIHFSDPRRPLSRQAQAIRHLLETAQAYPDDHMLEQFRFDDQKNVSPATRAMLDTFVTPCHKYAFDRVRFDEDAEGAEPEFDGNNSHQGDLMLHEFYSMVERLIEWRRRQAGSIVFVTPDGDIRPSDIGVDICKADVDDFLSIVDVQLRGHDMHGSEGLIRSY